MVKKFQFDDLFIYDLANNHQGNLQHGLRIIQEVGKVNRDARVRGALKFQFRQLETFIHPEFQDRMDLKFIKRFSETKLDHDDFRRLKAEIDAQGMLSMCTPFDEASVDVLCDMGIDILKVASCSAMDKPLLQEVARVNKPIVVSTGGLRIDEIDWLVNYLDSSKANFAIMHCIAIYPTPDDMLALNQIDMLRDRYPDITIGWSTHENQNATAPIQIAYAKGAKSSSAMSALKRTTSS